MVINRVVFNLASSLATNPMFEALIDGLGRAGRGCIMARHPATCARSPSSNHSHLADSIQSPPHRHSTTTKPATTTTATDKQLFLLTTTIPLDILIP